MNHSDTAELLALVAAFDQRTLGDADVIAWQGVLHDVTLPNARAAVIDYHRSIDSTKRRIVPADVRHGVKRVRERALANVEDPCPPAELVDEPDAYRAWQLEARSRIADEACLPTLAEPRGLPMPQRAQHLLTERPS